VVHERLQARGRLFDVASSSTGRAPRCQRSARRSARPIFPRPTRQRGARSRSPPICGDSRDRLPPLLAKLQAEQMPSPMRPGASAANAILDACLNLLFERSAKRKSIDWSRSRCASAGRRDRITRSPFAPRRPRPQPRRYDAR
jgi:hypothetical protein